MLFSIFIGKLTMGNMLDFNSINELIIYNRYDYIQYYEL